MYLTVGDLISKLEKLESDRRIEVIFKNADIGKFTDIKIYESLNYGYYFLYASKEDYILCSSCEGSPCSYNSGGFVSCSQCGEIGFLKLKE